jgi:hypothetical protein
MEAVKVRVRRRQQFYESPKHFWLGNAGRESLHDWPLLLRNVRANKEGGLNPALEKHENSAGMNF